MPVLKSDISYSAATEISQYPLCLSNKRRIFGLFPNPLTNLSTIKVSRANGHSLTMDFYDTFGRIVKQIRIVDTKTEIMRTDFNAGIYFYRLFDNDKPIGQGKLLIQ